MPNSVIDKSRSLPSPSSQEVHNTQATAGRFNSCRPFSTVCGTARSFFLKLSNPFSTSNINSRPNNIQSISSNSKAVNLNKDTLQKKLNFTPSRPTPYPHTESGIEWAQKKYKLSACDIKSDFTNRCVETRNKIDHLISFYFSNSSEEVSSHKKDSTPGENQAPPNKNSILSFMTKRRKLKKETKITLTDLPANMSLSAQRAIQEIVNYRKSKGNVPSIPLNEYKEIFSRNKLPLPFEVYPHKDDGIDIVMCPISEGSESQSVKTEKIYQSIVLDGYDYNIDQSGSGPEQVNSSSIEGKHRRKAFNMIFDQLGIPEKYRYIPQKDTFEF
ncbi:hypothetical protein ACJJI4_09490 [Microbulbifer sp. TRSA002]|uniref:hypothetical protein n=1 Tax=Microbulbifer sp. TRSA002 TaxID=3243382 RepID=UPI00403A0680